jgi:hypothetical protein
MGSRPFQIRILGQKIWSCHTDADLTYNFSWIKFLPRITVAAVEALQTLFRAPPEMGFLDLYIINPKLEPHGNSFQMWRLYANLLIKVWLCCFSQMSIALFGDAVGPHHLVTFSSYSSGCRQGWESRTRIIPWGQGRVHRLPLQEWFPPPLEWRRPLVRQGQNHKILKNFVVSAPRP